MKKISGILVLAASVATLSACNGMAIPTCYDELNECGRDSAYTEERTMQGGYKTVMKKVEPIPAPAPQPVPAPAPVAEPKPVVIDDTPVMQSAEPQLKHISK